MFGVGKYPIMVYGLRMLEFLRHKKFTRPCKRIRSIYVLNCADVLFQIGTNVLLVLVLVYLLALAQDVAFLTACTRRSLRISTTHGLSDN